MHHNKELQKLQMTESVMLQQEALDRGEAVDSGWLNASSNRYSDVLAMARNKFNRFVMYPSNRLHTAYIPDRDQLNSDPKQGRLTVNTFWELYHNIENHCDPAVMTALHANHLKIGSFTSQPRTPEEYYKACMVCKSLPVHCQWCPSLQQCMGDTDRVSNQCDDVPVFLGDNGGKKPENENDVDDESSAAHVRKTPRMLGIETSCKESALLMRTCLEQDSCDKCSSKPGCAWCLNSNACYFETQQVCKNKLDHVGKLGKGECHKLASEEACSDFDTCGSCSEAKCSWCLLGVSRCVVDVLHMCMTDEIEYVVGSHGIGHCSKKVATDLANWHERNVMAEAMHQKVMESLWGGKEKKDKSNILRLPQEEERDKLGAKGEKDGWGPTDADDWGPADVDGWGPAAGSIYPVVPISSSQSSSPPASEVGSGGAAVGDADARVNKKHITDIFFVNDDEQEAAANEL